MTSFQTLLCKIPENLDQKQIFVEIKFTSDFLGNFEKYISEVYDIISAVEKSYRAAAITFASAVQKTTTFCNGLPESNIVLAYVAAHEKRSAKLSQRATQLGNLLKNNFDPFKASFEQKKKLLKDEIQKLKILVQPALDDVYKSLNGYDKYFVKVQQSASISSTQPQNLLKALTQLDEKLGRTQNNYNLFHLKFAEYCRRRDQIFGEIDKLVADTSTQLNDIIKLATQVDSSFIDSFSFNLPKIEVNLSECWNHESDEEVSAKPFYVNPSMQINCGGTILSPNDALLVVEARGNTWTVQDRGAKVWQVPSKYLKPNPIMNGSR